MVTYSHLPPLREELAIHAAPPGNDGSPAWVLHDPTVNKFYQLTWPAFEILSRWHLGLPESVIEAVNSETTLKISASDLEDILIYLDQNFLLQPSAWSAARMKTAHSRTKLTWISWLLKNYLFFRIPLLKPERILASITPLLSWVFTRYFLGFVLLAVVIAFYPISRQWDVFVHSFTAYKSWSGIVSLALAVCVAKTIHEFGHAITAYRMGCRIPFMGIAFVVMFPMLYTDTNEVWKLTSHHKRLAVSVAGIASELLLAIISLWIWILLPDGPLRAAAFILSTSTWVSTLVLNASPFMRFDGYFILSDLLGIPNLHMRSFSFGRWKLREFLFGLGEPAPEPIFESTRHFLIFFAYFVWCYRFIVFTGIAVLVYHYFFKALGILLFTVEISWFVLLPIYHELASWVKLHGEIMFNIHFLRTLAIVLVLLCIVAVPWRGRFTAPAILSAAWEQHVFAPYGLTVDDQYTKESRIVKKEEVLVRFVSDDLQHRLQRAQIGESLARWQAEQQPFNEQMLQQGRVLQEHHNEAEKELSGHRREKERLTIRAAFDGSVVMRNDEITKGVNVAPKELLYVVAGMETNKVDAFVGMSDIGRIHVGDHARFIPDALEFGTFDCHVADIDRLNISTVEEPSLTSVYGGPLPARQDGRGNLYLKDSVFRVRLEGCSPNTVPPLRLQGTVGIKGERRSLIVQAAKHVYSTLIRESGF
jgi:putative peptide zinc metalloprotease protein